MTVDSAHVRAIDAVLLKKWSGKALHLDVPFFVIVDVIVHKMPLAALVHEDAARLPRVNLVALKRRVAQGPHAHASLGIVADLIALVQPTCFLVHPQATQPHVVDLIAAQRWLGMLDDLDADPVVVNVILEQKGRRTILNEHARPAVVVDAIPLE